MSAHTTVTVSLTMKRAIGVITAVIISSFIGFIICHVDFANKKGKSRFFGLSFDTT
jgi:hypothetical protein